MYLIQLQDPLNVFKNVKGLIKLHCKIKGTNEPCFVIVAREYKYLYHSGQRKNHIRKFFFKAFCSRIAVDAFLGENFSKLKNHPKVIDRLGWLVV